MSRNQFIQNDVGNSFCRFADLSGKAKASGHPFPARECCVVLAFSLCMVHIYPYYLKHPVQPYPMILVGYELVCLI